MFDSEMKKKKELTKMQDNAKLHKTHTQSILLYKIIHGHPHLQGEINANQLQACTADELKQKTAPMQST